MNIYDTTYRKYGLSQSQQKIIDLVGNNKKILEIGSSTGYMSKFFTENNCQVDVVEIDQEAVNKAKKYAKKVINLSIEDEKVLKEIKNTYDYILLADVLEHLVKPLEVLKRLEKIASKNTQLIISMPNIASWVVRKQLFFRGDFEYTDSGVLDKTHLHFYTPETLKKLLLESGWSVVELIGTITRLPFEAKLMEIPVISNIYKLFRQKIVERYKNLSYYHFIVVAVKSHK